MRPVVRRASGFALVWVIVTLAIIAAVVAAAAPSLVTLNDRRRAEKTVEQLRLLAFGIGTFYTAVGKYPGNVSQLTNAITTAQKNSCRGNYISSEAASWSGQGVPYVSFYTPPTGTWTPIGRIRDSIPVRTSVSGKPPLFVEFPGVTGGDAEMVNVVIDHGSGDSVTFNPPVNDTTTLKVRLIPSSLAASTC